MPAFHLTDGGRSAAGFSTANDAGDCVARAIAIATEQDYGTVYRDLAAVAAANGRRRSARDGVHKADSRQYLLALGWEWTPTMGIGTGCTVHLRADELPSGRLIVQLSKHLTAMVDGVIYDNHDPSRGGTRCVYGYWANPASDRLG